MREKELIFFGRAFGQAVLALTQRREIRSFFGDWGERSPTPSPRLRGEGWGEGKELNFLCRAFGQAVLALTQRRFKFFLVVLSIRLCLILRNDGNDGRLEFGLEIGVRGIKPPLPTQVGRGMG